MDSPIDINMLSVQEEVLSVRQEDIQAPNMEDFALFPVLPSRPKAPLKQECVLCIRLGFRGQENAHSMDDCQRCAICKEWFADGLNEHGAECVEKERAAVKASAGRGKRATSSSDKEDSSQVQVL